ncbi:serine protease [Mariniblastus sp.]|nr:serine protease [Mariniblastus sp.]
MGKRKSRSKDQAGFDKYFKRLGKSDPAIAKELKQFNKDVNESTDRSFALPSRFESPDELRPESVVLRVGRPVLDVRRGAAVIDIEEVESQVWKRRLTQSSTRLAPAIAGIGRIDVVNFPNPRIKFVGTGWLIRDNVVVTNRHVAELFAEGNGLEFRIAEGIDGKPISPRVDFLEEFNNDLSSEFQVFKVAYIEKKTGPDLAFLRIEPKPGGDLPDPVSLSSTAPQKGDQVAVVGYPARDPFFPFPETMDRIFKSRYDKKRLAPGLVTGSKSHRLTHDCSTLGGEFRCCDCFVGNWSSRCPAFRWNAF